MTVFRRKGRPSWTMKARTRTGWEQIGTGSKGKGLASRMASMWETLATEHRAWDLLDPVLRRERAIGDLYDSWVATKGAVSQMRAQLADGDVEPMIADFMKVYRAAGRRPDTANHVEAHIRSLIPPGRPRLVSTVTPAWLTERLAAYTPRPRAKPKPLKKGQEPPKARAATAGTRRKVHSSWTSFFAYCTRPRGVFASNPMDAVDRPALQRPPIQFYDLTEVTQILDKAPSPEMKALWALMYGGAVEISTALQLARRDVDEATHEVRAVGTKTHTRDRTVLIADWAWPVFLLHLKDKLPGAPLWPGLNRWAALDAHTEAAKAAKVRALPLRHSRHHWAVRQVRSGTPLGIVAAQLGHSSTQLTATVYGRFIPTTTERAAWERRARERDAAEKCAGA